MKFDISHITLPEYFHNMSDFYVPIDAPMYGIGYPGPLQLIDNVEYEDIIQFMLGKAQEKDRLEFSLDMIHEGRKVIFRGHSIESIEGKVYIFRRLPSYIPSIEEIGMPSNILELLTSERLNAGGLLIVAGETGQGKSTTAASSIAYRLKKYGSFCLTIEDPVELPLQGFYESEERADNKGVCFQTNVDADGVPEAIKSSLRCYPSVSNSILFLGETRDSLMAAEVLKIAANGHLVVTTLHGADLMTALRRFINLAMGAPGINEMESKAMFSAVFRMIIHQRLERLPSGKKRVRPKILFSPSATSSIASRLRSGNLELLSTDIQSQNMIIDKGQSLLNNLN